MFNDSVYLFPLFSILATATAGQETSIQVHPDEVIATVSRYMTGACIEDVNHEIYGGIYSQMIFGESFQEPAKDHEGLSGMWQPIELGNARGAFALESQNCFIGSQSQRIAYVGPISKSDQQARADLEIVPTRIGVANRSLNGWGMRFAADKEYEGFVWARCEKPVTLHVALESGNGDKTYAEAGVAVAAGDWQRLEFKLTPSTNENDGRFAIMLREPGSVVIGHVFLQPGEWGRFKGLPVRKDVAEAMAAQGLTVLRYGGSMINAPEYRWKKMIGPRERRPPYKGTWYPHSTNGWGILDFLNLCEAAGFLGIPAFNIEETPQDMADFVEYVNGGQDTAWGRKRAEDGHPEPYRLKYLEFGNEEKIDEHYWQRFEPVARAMWAKDPELIIVVGDFAYGEPITDPYNFKGSPSITSLAAHKKILDFAKENGREVWFDVHVGTHNPRDPEGLGGIPTFIDALKKLSPGAQFKIAVFELNATNHAIRRAISNAYAINQLERIGNDVRIVCSANALQPYKQNDNGWDQGLVFLTPNQVWGQPPYYVTQMFSQHYLPQVVRAEVTSPGRALDVTAKRSEDGKTLQLQIVNLENEAVEAGLDLGGFTPANSTVQTVYLTGELDDVNVPEAATRIKPKRVEWFDAVKAMKTSLALPARSFTIILMK